MPLYILDGVKIFESDEDNLIHAFLKNNRVLTGCGVTAQGAPNMTVNYAGGTILASGGVVTSAASAALAIGAADPTNIRIDSVVIDLTTGAASVVAGTAAATPKPAALPAGKILAAYVNVAAAGVSIQTSNITDRRLIGAAPMIAGTLATRPAAAAGNLGFVYFSTDDSTLWRDNGGAWVQIAPSASIAASTQPNLVLNSDFARKTILPGAASFAALAMPEAFADTSGYNVAAGSGTVASNIFTSTTAATTLAWPASAPGSWVWRDGRISATFKAVSTAGQYRLAGRWTDANNQVFIETDSVGNVRLRKNVGGVGTNLATVAQALTLNRWYWLELDMQGTTFTGKIYDTGGTASGVTKASSTLLQTLSGTATDSILAVGGIAILGDTNSTQWGGIAASPGGVYVEIPMPESWAVTFGGTLGGQAIGYDEAADAGPIGKQKPLRVYIPATSRQITVQQWDSGGGAATTVGRISPSTSYAGSAYVKTSGFAGSGNLLDITMYDYDLAGGSNHTLMNGTANAADAAWTRKTGAAASAATGRQYRTVLLVNPGLTASGTGWFDLPQLEQGSAATAWRNAPSDDAPMTWQFGPSYGAGIVLAAGLTEIDSANFAANVDVPWDATLRVDFVMDWTISAIGNHAAVGAKLDGSGAPFAFPGNTQLAYETASTAGEHSTSGFGVTRVAAGKHRVALTAGVDAGTVTVYGYGSFGTKFTITATRGK